MKEHYTQKKLRNEQRRRARAWSKRVKRDEGREKFLAVHMRDNKAGLL